MMIIFLSVLFILSYSICKIENYSCIDSFLSIHPSIDISFQ
uniref:Uncharacterized protein n=1 Tax=Brugia timori TaxID=42155 RepID=A0A0R3RAA4_9BILA